MSWPRRKSLARNLAGIISVEVAVLAIGLLGGIQMLLFAGRLAQAKGHVQDIAAEAVRIASQAQNHENANQRIQEFQRQLSQASPVRSDDSSITSCRLSLTPESQASFGRGQEIAMQASCEVSLSDLLYLHLPGSVSIEATAVEIIDRYRSQGS